MNRDLRRLLFVVIGLAVLLVATTWVRVVIGARTFETASTITAVVIAITAVLGTVITVRRDNKRKK